MKKISLAVIASFAPLAAFAQQQVGTTYVSSVTSLISSLLAWVIPVLITLAVIFFFWELIQLLMAPPDKRAERKTGLLWSILALFLMFSFFGVVKILQGVTGAQGGGSIDQSQIPTINL